MAPPEVLAKYLPDWAAEIALDAKANAEYEADFQKRRAQAFRAVEGREWSEEGGEGIEAFTPLEVAEDFCIPADAVLAQLVTLGVAEDRLKPNRPLREVCSAAQVNALANFAQGCDPIELRESFVDDTLEDIAEEMGYADGGARLLQLCAANDIPTRLGIQSQITVDQMPVLKLSISSDGLAMASLRDAGVSSPEAALPAEKRGPSEDDLTDEDLLGMFQS